MVGFHIDDYCLNFIDCCQRILGCRMDRNRMIVQYQSRLVHVKALPIGIPYSRFESMSRTAPRVFPAEYKVILGVDRLDYTKGLVARLKALDKMFEEYPHWIGRVTFLQVAVPSRTDVQEYRELKESIDQLVGQINGRFSTPAWSPIRSGGSSSVRSNRPEDVLGRSRSPPDITGTSSAPSTRASWWPSTGTPTWPW